jgi:hypothetical protein
MLLAELRRLGLKLTANAERHDVESVSLRSDQLPAAIRAHKTALLRELADEARPRRFPQEMEGATRWGYIGPAVDAQIASQELKSKQQPRVPMGRRFHSLTGECSLLSLDLARNAPRHVHLLIPFFFASRLGLILSD